MTPGAYPGRVRRDRDDGQRQSQRYGLDPWAEDVNDAWVPRRPGMGCLLAAILAALGLAVAAVLAAGMVATALSGISLR